MSGPRLQLDLARRAPRAPAVGHWLLLAGVAALAAAVVWIDAGARRVEAARSELDQQLEWAGRTQKADKSRPADPRVVKAERAAKAMQAELSLPWARLLEALESVQRADVALLVVEPNVAERRVRLQLEARGVDAMLAYLDALQTDGRLADVLLQSQQRGGEGSETAVRFMVSATWGNRP